MSPPLKEGGEDEEARHGCTHKQQEKILAQIGLSALGIADADQDARRPHSYQLLTLWACTHENRCRVSQWIIEANSLWLFLELVGAALLLTSYLRGGDNKPEVGTRRRLQNKWLGLLGAVFLLASGGLQLLAHYWLK